MLNKYVFQLVVEFLISGTTSVVAAVFHVFRDDITVGHLSVDRKCQVHYYNVDIAARCMMVEEKARGLMRTNKKGSRHQIEYRLRCQSGLF